MTPSSEPSATPDNAGKKKALKIGGIILLVVVAFFAFFGIRGAGKETTDDAFIEGHVIPISAKVAGQVTKVYVDDNQQVKEGDSLLDIDPRDYQAKLDEERAKVEAAEAEAIRAKADAARYTELHAKDEISKQQLDQANALAKQTQATLARERATEKTAELDLSYAKLVAPETGRVTRKAVESGAYVQVGQTLLSVVPTNVWITANFKETQLTHMRPGQPVTIKVDAYPSHKFTGKVDSIQWGTGERFSVLPAENATGNYVKVVQRVPVKIIFTSTLDENFHLAPGMSVEPTVTVK